MGKNSLTFGMSFLFLISIALLSYIVIEEKKVDIIRPKVETKITEFIEKNYQDEELRKEKIEYNEKEKRFEQKITSTKNKHLYFYLYYKKRKITSTYDKDYQKGKTLLSYLEKKITKEIAEKDVKVTIPTPLDEFSNEVKDLLLKEENLKSLKIYTLEKEIKVENFLATTINLEVMKLLLQNQKNQISPKNYTLILTNRTDITQSIKIENLNLPNNNLEKIITAILENDKTVETKYNIKYKFLN